MPMFIFIGILTSLGASFLGFFQEDGKRLLACSTAGQLGYVIVSIGLGFFEEAQLLLIFCCINKAFTFVWFGTIMQRFYGISDFRFISLSSNLSFGEHAGLLVALSNFSIFPGAFSWQIKGLFIKSYGIYFSVFTGYALDFLQLTWLLSSLYMLRLYIGVFLRTITIGLQLLEKKIPLVSYFYLEFFFEKNNLSLPLIIVSFFIFSFLIFFEGFFGLPYVDSQWIDLNVYWGWFSYF